MTARKLYVCPQCSDSFYRYSSNVRMTSGEPFCSRRCWQGFRAEKASPERYKVVLDPGHPLAMKSGEVLKHRKVLYAKIGPGPHSCEWCGEPVEWMTREIGGRGALLADHVDGNVLNNSPENLVPACHKCNTGRERKNTVKDEELYVTVTRTGTPYRVRAVKKVCQFCEQTFLREISSTRQRPVAFCSRSCSMKDRWRRPVTPMGAPQKQDTRRS
jgi:hypothetical protein